MYAAYMSSKLQPRRFTECWNADVQSVCGRLIFVARAILTHEHPCNKATTDHRRIYDGFAGDR